ncbi:hypothetical protein WJX72_010413 [[Myrmecia] bisecta]|uniref:EF-hand domain-containing protein n=1 Tax=[Myrmecia] bisecta TaxID=41462 RepID=A0AAW1PYP5_9CHLO
MAHFGAAELQQARVLYNCLKDLRRTVPTLADDKEWESQLKEEVEDISERTREAAAVTDEEVPRRAVLLLTRRDLTDICVEGLVEFFKHTNQPQASTLVEELRESFLSLAEDWRDLLEEQERSARAQLDAKQADVERAEKAAAELCQVAERLEVDSKALAKDNKALKKEVERLNGLNEALTRELQRMHSTRSVHSNDDASLIAAKPSTRRTTDSRDSNQASFGPPAAKVNAWAHTISPRKGNFNGAMRDPGQISRELTLKQLKDLIGDIFASKAKSDVRQQKAGQPRETMEQHVYAFLTQKFGLKQIITEWLAAILAAVEHYASVDAEVALFGKVLRNEVEEEFREHQSRVRGAVVDALRSSLAQRNPLLSDDDLTELVRRSVKGSLAQDVWCEVVNKVFKAKDAPIVLERVQHAATTPSPVRTASGRLAEQPRPEVRFSALMQIALKWHLDAHERALSPVVEAFRRIDTSKAGVLSDQQFAKFCHLINPSVSPKEVDVLMDTMDPAGTKQVSFSSCACTLAAELMRIMDQLPMAA